MKPTGEYTWCEGRFCPGWPHESMHGEDCCTGTGDTQLDDRLDRQVSPAVTGETLYSVWLTALGSRRAPPWKKLSEKQRRAWNAVAGHRR